VCVTKPDAQKGRGRKVHSSPTKDCALNAQVSVLCPHVLDADAIRDIAGFHADSFLVVSYGKMLPDELLIVPPLGAFNIHPSLLPKYRGASPAQYAILNGDEESGVSIIKITSTVDGGDIVYQERLSIDTEMTTPAFLKIAAERVGEDIDEVFNKLVGGTLSCVLQDEAAVTRAPLIKKEDGAIDWTSDARTIHNKIRAFIPWPLAYTQFEGKRVSLFSSSIVSMHEQYLVTPGTIVGKREDGSMQIMTGEGVLSVGEVQMEGKNKMNAVDWMNGRRISEGVCFV